MGSPDVLQAARSVGPVLRAHRASAERRARPADEVVAALGEAGLFLLAAPADVGGLQPTLVEIYQVAEELATADPAVSWLVANSGVMGLLTSRVDRAARAEIFADPSTPFGNAAVPAGKAVRVGDGFELSGSWPFCTGAELADWFALAGVVEPPAGAAPGPPEVRTFLVPRAEVTVERTWDDASTLRGTGSHAVGVERVHVPLGFAPAPTDPILVDGPLFRVPRLLVFVGATAAAQLGCLAAALDTVVALGSGKTSRVDGSAHADQPHVQEVVAGTEAALRALRAGLYGAALEVWDDVVARGGEGELPRAVRARAFASLFHTSDSSCAAVGRLYQVSTSAAYATSNRVEQALREVHSFAVLLESARDVYRSAGRVMLGGDPIHPAF